MAKFLIGLTALIMAATPAFAQQVRYADPHPIDFSQPWNTDILRPQAPGIGVRIITREDPARTVVREIPMSAAAACPRATEDGASKQAVPQSRPVQKPSCDTKPSVQDKAQP